MSLVWAVPVFMVAGASVALALVMRQVADEAQRLRESSKRMVRVGVGVRVAVAADMEAETWTFMWVSSFQRETLQTGAGWTKPGWGLFSRMHVNLKN